MTKYEENVKGGIYPPMNSFEWLLLPMMCEDIIQGNIEEMDKEAVNLLWDEIEHFYKDEPDKLEILKKFKI